MEFCGSRNFFGNSLHFRGIPRNSLNKNSAEFRGKTTRNSEKNSGTLLHRNYCTQLRKSYSTLLAVDKDMETWRHENMDMEHENMGIWKHENMETWRHGNANGYGGMGMKIWTWRYRLGHGDMNIDMKTWRWRHGDGDMDMRDLCRYCTKIGWN
jgi:hypothetical protein